MRHGEKGKQGLERWHAKNKRGVEPRESGSEDEKPRRIDKRRESVRERYRERSETCVGSSWAQLLVLRSQQ